MGLDGMFRLVDAPSAQGNLPLQAGHRPCRAGRSDDVHFMVMTARYDAVASQPWSSDTTHVLTLDLAATPCAAARGAWSSKGAGRPNRPQRRRASPRAVAASPPGALGEVPACRRERMAPAARGADLPTGAPVLPGCLGGPPATPSRTMLRLGCRRHARRGAATTIRLTLVNADGQLAPAAGACGLPRRRRPRRRAAGRRFEGGQPRRLRRPGPQCPRDGARRRRRHQRQQGRHRPAALSASPTRSPYLHRRS